MTQGTLKETALETKCDCCGRPTDELEPGPYGIYLCFDCHETQPETLEDEDK